jgi:hypothetical protein
MRQPRKKVKYNDQVAQPLRRHGMSSVSENMSNLMVWLETVVEALYKVATSSENQAQSTIESDLEDDQEETPKPNKHPWKEDHASSSLTDVSADDVSEPELPFKSPRTVLNASQSRRMTKKTYAEAVSGESGSEDEAEVKMRKKVVQQQSQERHIEKGSTVRLDDSDDLCVDCST